MRAYKHCRCCGEGFASWMAEGEWREAYRVGARTVPGHQGTRLICSPTLVEAVENYRGASVLEVEVPDDSPRIILGLCADQRLWSLNWERVRRTHVFGYLIGGPWFTIRQEGEWQRIMWHQGGRDDWSVNRRLVLAEYCDVLREVA